MTAILRVHGLRSVVLAAVLLASTAGIALTAAAQPEGHGSILAAAWSPDGQQIAWASSGTTGSTIWLAAADGTGAHAITKPIDSLSQLVWVPGGRLLYDANFTLFRLSPTGVEKRVGLLPDLSFSTDAAGDLVAAGSAGCPLCHGPIVVRSPAGGPVTEIGGAGVANVSPSLSPDGRRVAFARFFYDKRSGEYGKAEGIWISPTRGGPLRRLTRAGICARWSPDGRTILYGDLLAGGLRTVRAVGGPSRLLTRGSSGCAEAPIETAWAPDSKSVAFVGGNGRLVVVDVASRQARTLTGATFGQAVEPVWSPDSGELLVGGRPPSGGCVSLWLVRADGSGSRLLRRC